MKKNQNYIDALYSKMEQKKIMNQIFDLKSLSDSLDSNAVSVRQKFDLIINDFLLLTEKYRLLKKHFKLSEKQVFDIIDKMEASLNKKSDDFDPLNAPVKERMYTNTKKTAAKKKK